MKRSAVALFVILVGLTATGCSGSSGGPKTSPSTPTVLSASAYKKALAHVAQEASHAQRVIAPALHAKNVGTIHHALLKFAASQQRVARELEVLHPPANAVTANAALAAAFKANAAATRSVAARIATANTARRALAIIGSSKAAQATGQKIDDALAKLKRLGYTKAT